MTIKPMDDQRRVTKQEIAEICGVSTKTIERWVKRRGMPCLKIGTLTRYRVCDVEAWAREHDPSRELPSATQAYA